MKLRQVRLAGIALAAMVTLSGARCAGPVPVKSPSFKPPTFTPPKVTLPPSPRPVPAPPQGHARGVPPRGALSPAVVPIPHPLPSGGGATAGRTAGEAAELTAVSRLTPAVEGMQTQVGKRDWKAVGSLARANTSLPGLPAALRENLAAVGDQARRLQALEEVGALIAKPWDPALDVNVLSGKAAALLEAGGDPVLVRKALYCLAVEAHPQGNPAAARRLLASAGHVADDAPPLRDLKCILAHE